MKTVLLANGPINDYASTRHDAEGCEYVIACDGGLRHAEAMGLRVDCVIGDMDSVSSETLSKNTERGASVQRHPADKDDTDLALAMTHALERGATEITVLGALGDRFDHTLANIHALAMALLYGVPAEIRDENTCLRIVDKSCVLRRDMYTTLSLIPLTTEVTGITTTGLVFPLHGETLRLGTTRGVSNRFAEAEATVTVKEGLLLAIQIK